ncbi:MAG: transcriptional regulator [Clostridium cadaveris]|uniref:Transcriptional regulator n=1 Tax=Clostridium cadaveris TaxID=1529 RepID=A0A316M6B9_9CLOT|nr:MAG: transcriptional regulator [Clostridium cadaveris]
MNVKIARIKMGLTQAELCKIVKTSPKKLVEIERGHYENITKSLMQRIAKALNSDVQTLFFSDEE